MHSSMTVIIHKAEKVGHLLFTAWIDQHPTKLLSRISGFNVTDFVHEVK